MAKTLKNASDEELRYELERREAEKRRTPPKPLAKPDFSELIETVIRGTRDSIENGYEDDDLPHHIYEAAIDAIYGDKYWEWRRLQGW